MVSWSLYHYETIPFIQHNILCCKVYFDINITTPAFFRLVLTCWILLPLLLFFKLIYFNWRLITLQSEKAMAPHSSTLAGKIPWTEDPGRLQSRGLRRVRHNWATSLSLFTFMHWRGKWQPTPVFLPGESQGLQSLVAAIYGVAQSQTRLKQLSSSSTLQYCSGFCHTLTWISHGCTWVPHPEPTFLPIPSLRVIPVHQPWAPSPMQWTWAGDLFHIW